MTHYGRSKVTFSKHQTERIMLDTGDGWYADLGAMRFTPDHVVVMDVSAVIG